MTENTTLWDRLGKTDPKHTKAFTRGGGFKGTAIKPMWSYRRMTEEFGPCGEGWGIEDPTFQVLAGPDDEKLVFCTVGVWYGKDRNRLVGVGGDKAVAKNKYGVASDDEAFKKAFTDAVTNALKMIGVGADVHMGLFDDSKYVKAVAEEFSDADAPINPPPAKSSAQLKRDGFWPDFERELAECQSLVMLEKFKTAWREKAIKDGWNKAFASAAKDRIEGREREIMNAMEAEEFPGDRKSNFQHPIMAG